MPTNPSTTASSNSNTAAPRSFPAWPRSGTFPPTALTYTFHLRKGVKWHASNKAFKPTRDFNADDVLFMFERQWKEDNAFFKVTSPNHSYFSDMGMPKLIKSVEKVNDLTIKITLNKPEAPFLANLAMPYAAVQSKEYADAMLKAGTPEKIDQDPVGTGPFYLVQYQKDAVIRYKAFPQYWGGKARSTTSCTRSRLTHRSAGPSCRRTNARSCLPQPRRPGRDPQGFQRHHRRAGRPERGLPRLQHDQEAV